MNTQSARKNLDTAQLVFFCVVHGNIGCCMVALRTTEPKPETEMEPGVSHV